MGSNAAIVVAALAGAGVLARGVDGTPAPNQLLLLVAFGALAVAIVLARRQALNRRLVLGLSGALLLTAVVVPPMESNDVWAYAMYGRIVSRHHASPYTHSAANYPHDRWTRRVDHVWRRTNSVYGPAFTAVSAAGMLVAGDSPILARLFFQSLAALAVALAMLVVWKRTRDPAAMALIGINPVIVISVVNGAHNDALVGLAVLVGVLLAIDRRPVAAGLVLSLGAMVKIIGLLPLAAVALWLWRRDGFRTAASLGGAAASLFAVGLLLSGGPAMLKPLQSAQRQFTGGTIWNGPRRWVTQHKISAELIGGRRAGRLARAEVAQWATLSVLGLSALLAARRLRDRTPALIAGVVVLAYMLAGSYVYPWYVAWSLPALALVWRHRLAWVAMAQAAALHIAALPDPRLRPPLDKLYLFSPDQSLQFDIYRIWMPLLTLTLLAVTLVVTFERPTWRARPDVGEDDDVPEPVPQVAAAQ